MEEFTKTRFMSFPREINVGHKVVDYIGRSVEDCYLGGTALIVTGPKTKHVAGNRVYDLLQDGGFEPQLVEMGECNQENVDTVENLAREIKANFMIGVGGGAKIEITKIAATNTGLPYINVPTATPHDGICSPRAVLQKGGDHPSIASIAVKMPMGVFADTEILQTQPYKTHAAGCADVLSNITAVMDWELAKRLRNVDYSTSAATLSKLSAQVMMDYAGFIRRNTEDSIWLSSKAIIVSGICISIAGSSEPASGAEHMFSHSLDMIAPGKALHGEKAGLGSIMMMYLHGGDWKKIKASLEKFGAPTTAKEAGFTNEEIIKGLVKAGSIRPGRFTILGTNGLTDEAAANLARTTGVID